MEKHKAQFDAWMTYFNEMEKKLSLLNEHIFVDLKEKENFVTSL
jgi:regulator of RNase E activity RraB